ncbi:YceI family protein, partial [Streptococcus pseudopneumoniae]|uniref:YceI family protein n=1 Tax=Streptococcus pseudopneumoniae TaxID=257758 RepID=UPI001485C3CB
MIRKIPLLLGLVVLFSAPSAWSMTYEIDKDHSAVSFRVRHLVTKVRGTFNDFSGTFVYEEGKPKTWKAEVTVDIKSIDTNVKERDKHLRSKDFFYVEKFPKMKFVSTKIS